MTRPQLPLVDLRAQRISLEGELERACVAALASGDYVLGAEVAAFEHEFARFCDARHAVGVASGSAALELALRALEIGPGDEVITAANTFVATTLSIAHAGARPVLVDSDPLTHTIEPRGIAAAITSRTRAIVPVHLYGQCADMGAILDVARRHGLAVVDDACQAHGARYQGERAGSFGHAAAFSFYPSKNLGTVGDGGMIVTDDDDLAEKARLLRNYGQRQKYRSDLRGQNSRLDTLHAAILRVKLPRLDGWNTARRAHAARYDEVLRGLPVTRPNVRRGSEHVWHLYVVRVERRDAVRARLAEQGIETGIHYPVPVHLQPAHSDLAYRSGDFPISEHNAREVLSLPMYPELPAWAPERVADALRAAFDEVTRATHGVATVAEAGV
jgi:dTDP-4-amino-4,6-dideoxygalactose transaminase